MTDTSEQNNALVEPRLAYILDRKIAHSKRGPYRPKTAEQVEAALERLLNAEGFDDVRVSRVKRMTGGASKEQFSFALDHRDAPSAQTYVLRMDPLEGIVETCRLREAELLRALASEFPVPPVLAVDGEGEHLGNPGLITGFVPGVTKPTDMAGQSVSGIGSSYGRYAEIIAPQFLKTLVGLHSWQGWRQAELPNFVMPAANSTEAALYQVGLWSRVWREDLVEPVPLITLTEQWLRANAPVCEAPCLVHCDYRVGNFMFEEPSGQITTILDWELAHFGDFHEDLAWILQRLFGSWDEKGHFLVCGLMERERFLEEYQRLSGRTIDPAALRYYEIMNAWKCAIMDLSSAVIAGQRANNHQDLLITWLGAAGSVFLAQIGKLIGEEVNHAA
ncbi:phosphotransferase family protein [Spongiibacter taiwanensis]|uniref:phosphotransferase family protein n=1 Tax=Spongiibacter taiwanensis TaxID=1748242 RepID=UPI002035F716|nr:phosphotransferase family protein [Spongiibacter taiwanensis]USA41643.1 phosphotransferase family protein [Spongiibacter taiwanensis]